MLASAANRLRFRFGREEWNIGVVSQSAEDVVRHGMTAPIRWLHRRPSWSMLADPAFLLQPNGRQIVFAEHLNYWMGRGEIWAGCIRAGADISQVVLRPWMRSSGHLSYPRPFRDLSGQLFFMVESWETGALHLWRANGNALVHIGPIIRRPVLDPTAWHDGTTWWLFCTFKDDGPNERLQLFHASQPEGPWIAHPANPVRTGLSSCRPAGPLFQVNGSLVRPAQDCSVTYGGAVVLNEIMRLDKTGFHEVLLPRLQPDSVYPDGLHTFCPAGDTTLVDGKRWAFRASDVPRKVIVAANDHLRQLRRIDVLSEVYLPGPEADESLCQKPAST